MAMNPTLSHPRRSAINIRDGRLGWRWTWSNGILLFSIIMMMVRVVDSRPANSRPLYVFDDDNSFNLTSKSGYPAPKCSRLCYPFDHTVFESGKVPCSEFEGDPDKWVPCLCTDRPFLRFLSACIFHKCGPAIPSAFEFGYNICQDYKIAFPPPPDALKKLNVTLPNDAIVVPSFVRNVTLANELPAPQNGASDSNENPGILYELQFLKAIGSHIVRSRGLVLSSVVLAIGWATLF